jgi:hypothetical protein
VLAARAARSWSRSGEGDSLRVTDAENMRTIALNILRITWPNLPIELGCRYQGKSLIDLFKRMNHFSTWV